jgi:hypothetical protein
MNTMRKPHRWTLGAFLTAFGLLILFADIIFGQLNLASIGLASFLIGLLTLSLSTEETAIPNLVNAYALSSIGNTERLLREFVTDSRAVYLKVVDRNDIPMIFVPMTDYEHESPHTVPTDDQLLVVNPKDPKKMGLLVEAPGASLLRLMEKEAGLEFFDVGIEEVFDVLRTCMVATVELVSDVRGSFTETGLKLKIREGPLEEVYRSVVRTVPTTASKLGCPICSAAICAIAMSVNSEMALESAVHDSGFHEVTLSSIRGEHDEVR